MGDDQISKVAALGQQMAHVVESLAEIKTMILAMRDEYVRKDHHDFKLSALEDRVKAIEAERADERKNGGMLAWWKNVTAVFAGLAVICTVVGVIVTLGLRIAGPR